MFSYDDFSNLESENANRLVELNTRVWSDIIKWLGEFETLNESSKSEDALKERFYFLVAITVQHAFDAVDIANALGVTVSTIHRWSKGKFVPSQDFVRKAAIRTIKEMLEKQLKQLKTLSKPDVFPNRHRPLIVGDYNGK